MQQHIHPRFATAIGNNIAYWCEQAAAQSDSELRTLTSHHAEIVQAAQFGAALPPTHLLTLELVETCFNLIERGRLESLWLPILETIKNMHNERLADAHRHQLDYRLATLLRLQQRFNEAIALLDTLHGKPLTEQMQEQILVEISENWRLQGALSIAKEFALQALVQFEQIGNQRWQATVLNNLGILDTELQDFDAAASCLERALKLEQEADDATRIVRVLTNQGRLFQQLQQPWRAMSVYLDAQAYLEQTESIGDKLTVLINLATVYMDIGQFDRAVTTLKEAKSQLDLQRGLLFFAGLIDLNLGAATRAQGHYQVTLRYLQNSAEIWQQLRLPLHFGRTAINLGDTYADLQQFEHAVDRYRTAIATLRQLEPTPQAQEFIREAEQKLVKVSGAH